MTLLDESIDAVNEDSKEKMYGTKGSQLMSSSKGDKDSDSNQQNRIIAATQRQSIVPSLAFDSQNAMSVGNLSANYTFDEPAGYGQNKFDGDVVGHLKEKVDKADVVE